MPDTPAFDLHKKDKGLSLLDLQCAIQEEPDLESSSVAPSQKSSYLQHKQHQVFIDSERKPPISAISASKTTTMLHHVSTPTASEKSILSSQNLVLKEAPQFNGNSHDFLNILDEEIK